MIYKKYVFVSRSPELLQLEPLLRNEHITFWAITHLDGRRTFIVYSDNTTALSLIILQFGAYITCNETITEHEFRKHVDAHGS